MAPDEARREFILCKVESSAWVATRASLSLGILARCRGRCGHMVLWALAVAVVVWAGVVVGREAADLEGAEEGAQGYD